MATVEDAVNTARTDYHCPSLSHEDLDAYRQSDEVSLYRGIVRATAADDTVKARALTNMLVVVIMTRQDNDDSSSDDD